MVCPCGVGGVALFALPAAFAKFNALPAPKKKAAALVLVPLVLALAAWCAPATNQPTHCRAATLLTPCGPSLQVPQARLHLLLLRVPPDQEHGPWLRGTLASGNQERSSFWLLAAV